MKPLLRARSVTCPCCWEPHLAVFDMTDEQRTLTEDCRECCNPLQISYELDDGDVCSVNVEPLS